MSREIPAAEIDRWLRPDDTDFSRTTNYSDYSITSRKSERSAQFNQKKLQRDKSLSKRAQKVAAVFTTCFVPHRNRRGEVIDEEDAKNTSRDVSIVSTSNKSTASSSGKYKFHSGDLREQQQGTTVLSMATIYKATSNFAEENVIGQGGFGTVYKGKLKDGSLVAVKRAKKNMHETHLSSEFKNEIETLSKVDHLNLVKLLGYIEHDDERLVVVEYVSNGNLREHLDGRQATVLDLEQRLNIAIDVAHAIAYMHSYADRPIIHRDIKASNILLTDNFRAKVADFGFACLVPENSDATHISTQIKGTSGYLDPEYIHTYQLTEKSDVYSFGVLLVELITGRRPLEQNRNQRERVTTRWAVHKYKEGNVVMAMDARLRRNPASVMAAEGMMRLAEECMAPSRRSRPAMRRCAEVLWDIRRVHQEMLKAPLPPRRPPSSSASSSRRSAGGGEEIKQT